MRYTYKHVLHEDATQALLVNLLPTRWTLAAVLIRCCDTPCAKHVPATCRRRIHIRIQTYRALTNSPGRPSTVIRRRPGSERREPARGARPLHPFFPRALTLRHPRCNRGSARRFRHYHNLIVVIHRHPRSRRRSRRRRRRFFSYLNVLR